MYGLTPVPNQYSGRYIRYWKSLMLYTLKSLPGFVAPTKGKMYVACVVGCSAYVTVLVSVGCTCPPDVAPLAGPHAATSAASPAAAQHAASTRRIGRASCRERV